MAQLTHDHETRTTTLIFGPFVKPLSVSDEQLAARVMARTIGLGYATMKTEDETSITITAVLSAPRSQPFSRNRPLAPSVAAAQET